MSEVLVLPEGFLWGAATAAHQIEGNNVSSDWWQRENRPDSIIPQRSGDAADSYHRYPEDIRMLAELGFNSYRFSVEWARIEPEEGQFSRAELAHYRAMIDCCLENGLKPVVTLHHFTNPQWLVAKGGWSSPRVVDYFVRYVEAVMPILEDVEWIVTINEPNMAAIPRPEDLSELTAGPIPAPDPALTKHLTEAHREARRVLAPLGAKTGWSVATQAYHAMPGYEEETRKYGYDREDYFLEVARGDDFIGVQAYLRTFIGKGGPQPIADGVETTLTGWEYFPPALAIGIRNAWKWTEGVPVLVTENGLATQDDDRRVDYTFDALVDMFKAMEDGIQVDGYLHWSALDNYEWGSFKPTFGLIAWDPVTFARSAKPSAHWLGEAGKTRELRHPRR